MINCNLKKRSFEQMNDHNEKYFQEKCMNAVTIPRIEAQGSEAIFCFFKMLERNLEKSNVYKNRNKEVSSFKQYIGFLYFIQRAKKNSKLKALIMSFYDESFSEPILKGFKSKLRPSPMKINSHINHTVDMCTFFNRVSYDGRNKSQICDFFLQACMLNFDSCAKSVTFFELASLDPLLFIRKYTQELMALAGFFFIEKHISNIERRSFSLMKERCCLFRLYRKNTEFTLLKNKIIINSKLKNNKTIFDFCIEIEKDFLCRTVVSIKIAQKCEKLIYNEFFGSFYDKFDLPFEEIKKMKEKKEILTHQNDNAFILIRLVIEIRDYRENDYDFYYIKDMGIQIFEAFKFLSPSLLQLKN